MNNRQSGQTLIETIVAIFILTAALTSGLSLTVYALSNSRLSINQLIATNLAREGVEVVRMMRDTNWLEGDKSGGSYGLDGDCGSGSGQNGSAENRMDGKTCYPRWMTGPISSPYHGYDICQNPPNGSNNCSTNPQAPNTDYRLEFDPVNYDWALVRLSGSRKFNLCLQADGTYQHNNTCDSDLNPPFARRVQIIQNSTVPANTYTPLNPELVVKSVVIWSDKKCPSIAGQDPLNFNTKCKVVVEEHLTNWKDYK
jgi:type II secretory pathway pseudopilin PulG